ncbi:nitroreductase family protein [Caldibacillus lycopersici]|uniref:Nitroreductase family protein n=1 Tax=Perspicuibacillus lycopersici TaxID=1325689 RepID=A0AAE3IWB8_9BACI|nr:nitroreductase family protein [Perspicuibacillus lycopersici]MCU9614793.1 nitroreductase family protein [Perspicuibacillus lycopersici]
MINTREASYPIDTVYLQRWSPRSFLNKPIPEETLFSLFEAARWAPSAFNNQPWRFILARTEEDREKFYSFISEFNLNWCKNAPVLSLIISETENERGFNKTHAFDTGAAWGYLSLEATKKGLVTHPMTGFNFEKARSVLNIPEKFAINALVAIGYQGEKNSLPEVLQERENPSPRRGIKASLFEGSFGMEMNETTGSFMK